MSPHTLKRKCDVCQCLHDPDKTTQPKAKKPYKPQDESTNTTSKKEEFAGNLVKLQATSLPLLSTAEADNIWRNMLSKERVYPRDKNVLTRHPDIKDRMRAILLEWLMEVCEDYRLQRETFYLAKDYFDRFMASQENLSENDVQLIGITCLFIACKVEEIRSPKLEMFEEVTDCACSSKEILRMEVLILKALNWNLSPMTEIMWLNVYIQIAFTRDFHVTLQTLCPQHIYMQSVRLLDLCILDVNFLKYPCSLVAASVLYQFCDVKPDIELLSGYTLADICECTKDMTPFGMAINEIGKPAEVKYMKEVAAENRHNIQTNMGGMDLLAKAQAWMKILEERSCSSSDRADAPE